MKSIHRLLGSGRREGTNPASSAARHRSFVRADLAAAAGLLVLLAAFGAVHPLNRWLHAAGTAVGPAPASAATPNKKATQLYTCPMHPNILETHPGDCPICGMKLVPVKGVTAASEAESAATTAGSESAQGAGSEAGGGMPGMNMAPAGQAAAPSTGESPAASRPASPGGPEGKRKILFYRNPMDPTITSPVPQKDEMGMDYVPVYADEAANVMKQGAVVHIDPVTVQNMNVTIEPVRRQDVRREIRTVGYLDYDQEKVVSVTTKYSGFVERARVNYVGQPVRRGDPLFDVYSPELVQTEQELLSARRYADAMKDAPADVASRARALYEAVRARLAYWDISEQQIRDLEERGEVSRTLTVTAAASGVVSKRMDGLEGMAIKPGMDLLQLADLSTLWLVVEVYENQLPWAGAGSPATMTFVSYPGESFAGKVRYVEPRVLEKTRTLRLTLEVPNRDGRLKAGMYATVRFQPLVARDAITIPSQSVLRTGERNLVVVALGGGRFAPREVQLGPEGDGFVQVLSGLRDGDQVVTSSQFLIDSESNLRAAIQQMIAERAGAAGQ